MSPDKTFKIVVLPGDGIGPEVTSQAIRVLNLISSKSSAGLNLDVKEFDFGGCAIDNFGVPLPDETLHACKEADAVLLGAVGGPKWGVGKVRPEQGLLKLRQSLNLYANIRPANFAAEGLLKHSPLKEEIAKGVDIVVVRELIGGIYFGEREEAQPGPDGHAYDTMSYSTSEIQRITSVAISIARSVSPPMKIHSIDKANVLASSRLWRRVVTECIERENGKGEGEKLELDHILVDSAAMVMVSNPRKLNGVVLTENLFGDILSDESSVIPGSLGLLPSASLAGAPSTTESIMGLYEPIHGSAPDIAGQDIANPIGTILSAAMMLRYSLGREKEAELIEESVRRVLDSEDKGGYDYRTRDLGGKRGTREVGDKVCEVLEGLLGGGK